MVSIVPIVRALSQPEWTRTHPVRHHKHSHSVIWWWLRQWHSNLTLRVRVCLYWSESESNITSRWVHRESNLIFTLSSDKIQRKKFVFAFAFTQYKWSLNRPLKLRRFYRLVVTSCSYFDVCMFSTRVWNWLRYSWLFICKRILIESTCGLSFLRSIHCMGEILLSKWLYRNCY